MKVDREEYFEVNGGKLTACKRLPSENKKSQISTTTIEKGLKK